MSTNHIFLSLCTRHLGKMLALRPRFQPVINKLSQVQTVHINTRNVLFKQNTLKIEINGHKLQFPYIWLRDNCQCESCFHRTAKSRTIDWSNFNTNVKVKEVTKGENSVKLTWDDGHTSEFNFNWLKFRNFTEENRKRYDNTIYKPKKVTWDGKNFEEICTKHDYNEIITSDEALYTWLHKLSEYGVALIQNTPNTATAVDKVVERIGFPRRTHYGIKFTVQNVANTSNVAYLSSNLQVHIDLPYYDYCPGVNMLHCLEQTLSRGGENLLCDSHYVALHMKENHPEQFQLLTETDIEWSDIGIEEGNEFFKLHRAPVICLGKDGEITRINFSVPQRGNYFPGSMDVVEPWYEAWAKFLNISHKFAAKFKTKPGDILTFDNIRLLHGRNAYEDSSSNVRKLIGVYLDWDEIFSRWRCLKVKLEKIDGV